MVMNTSMIQRISSLLHKDFTSIKGEPHNPTVILNHFNFTVETINRTNMMAHYCPNKYKIYLNQEKTPQTQRMILAHCLGHYILGHKYPDNFPEENAKTLLLGDYREIEANIFAHNFVMPEKEVRQYVRELKDVEEQARIFGVSQKIMIKRFKDLGFLS